MRQHKTPRLYDKQTAQAFYQDRYAHGYMDDWPTEQKHRIAEIIRDLELPQSGEALDFGCGNGVLTDVIKRALPPGWTVCGTDISQIAVDNAGERYPDCDFFVADDPQFKNKQFDFLFTHHVLEHVYNLPESLSNMAHYLKQTSTMLHILPCGNAGSFERNVCLLRTDGINPQLENRFFFEDEGHVRRLTTGQLAELCIQDGFQLTKAYYRCQYDGAIDWITRTSPTFLRTFSRVSSAVDAEAKSKQKQIRRQLFLLWASRYPAAFAESRLRKKHRSFLDNVLLLVSLPLYPFTKPMDSYLKRKALDEWRQKRTEPNGSEMYLFFSR